MSFSNDVVRKRPKNLFGCRRRPQVVGVVSSLMKPAQMDSLSQRNLVAVTTVDSHDFSRRAICGIVMAKMGDEAVTHPCL